MRRRVVGLAVGIVLGLSLAGCAQEFGPTGASSPASRSASSSFSIAVIPDTQNYVDYTHQAADGFPIDSSELFIAQMRDVARRSVNNGGDVVFLASVGDVWQHQTERIDLDHVARGFKTVENPVFTAELKVGDEAKTIEIPKAIEGYQIIAAAGLPFGVAPGNHDYDGSNPHQHAPNRSTLLNDYFPVSRYRPMSTFGGTFEPDKTDSSYHLFRAAGQACRSLDGQTG